MNRSYLLLTLIAALILPALSINIASISVTERIYSITLPEIIAESGTDSTTEGTGYSVWQLLLLIYIAGVAFFFIKIVRNLSRIFTIPGTPFQARGKVLLIKVKDLPSFSFLNLIFLNRDKCGTDAMEQVVQHELVHVKQCHSIDIILVEVVQSLLWFNPLLILYKNELKAVHEFIADKETIKATGTDHFEYGKLLLNQLMPNRELQLAHLFSNNHIKNRIIMLSKKRTKRNLKAGYLLVLPVFALATLLFSCEGIVESNEDTAQVTTPSAEQEVYKVAEQMPVYPGGMEALMAYMGENLNYPEDAKSDKVEGTVITSFVINKKGKVEQVTVRKGVNEALNAEAVRVIKEMEDWTPGQHNGKTVAVEMNLPVKFKLNQ